MFCWQFLDPNDLFLIDANEVQCSLCLLVSINPVALKCNHAICIRHTEGCRRVECGKCKRPTDLASIDLKEHPGIADLKEATVRCAFRSCSFVGSYSEYSDHYSKNCAIKEQMYEDGLEHCHCCRRPSNVECSDSCTESVLCDDSDFSNQHCRIAYPRSLEKTHRDAFHEGIPRTPAQDKKSRRVISEEKPKRDITRRTDPSLARKVTANLVPVATGNPKRKVYHPLFTKDGKPTRDKHKDANGFDHGITRHVFTSGVRRYFQDAEHLPMSPLKSFTWQIEMNKALALVNKLTPRLLSDHFLPGNQVDCTLGFVLINKDSHLQLDIDILRFGLPTDLTQNPMKGSFLMQIFFGSSSSNESSYNIKSLSVQGQDFGNAHAIRNDGVYQLHDLILFAPGDITSAAIKGEDTISVQIVML